MSNKALLSTNEMDEEIPLFGERFNEMRKTNKFTDCSFKVDDKIMNCHKLILTASSPVFEAMFYGTLAETKSVKISDIKPNVFEIMLDFIYTGNINFSDILHIEEILELYYCAQKYMIDRLKNMCIKYIGANIKPENVLKVLDIAYSINLDNIIFSCLYVLRHWLASGRSFSNIILDSNFHISKKCLNLILQDNYVEFNDNILCLLRAWCIIECEQLELEMNSDNLKLILKEFQLSGKLISDVINRNSAVCQYLNGDKYSWKSYQRMYWKAARPLIVGDEMEVETNISTNKFIILKSININSRLIPQLLTIDFSDTYTENIVLEISSKTDIIYKNHHVIAEVEYNTNVEIKLNEKIVLFPDTVYSIKIKWDTDSLGNEYPRSIFSTYGKCKQFRIGFSENIYLQSQGGIMSGVVCDLYK